MWRAVFIFRQTEGSFRSFSGRKKTDGKPDGLPSAALAKVRRDENNLWSLAPEHDPNDMAGKDAVPTGQTAKRLMTTDDIAATIEANLHELKLPMGKTLLIETIREKIDASKAKAESALEMLCDKGVLAVRKGDPAQNQQAMKCYYPGPGYSAESLSSGSARV